MIPLRDRFLGCIMGLAVGDATGAPYEGMPATAIWYDLGAATRLVNDPPVDVLMYTDDTQMCIGVAETLLECGRIDEDVLAGYFARNYERGRGYGQGARRIVEAVAAGKDWRELARTIFPGGSLGNGAAMRVAPVGLFFHDDLDRVADEAVRSALPTHTHPVGVDGARIMALAVALCLKDGPFDRAARLGPNDSVAEFGQSLEAHRSVVTAVACFASSPDDYTRAIAGAIALGDDTDTIAAMAGALCGARGGIAAVPAHLLDRLEDGPKGKGYLLSLATRLHDQRAVDVARRARRARGT